MTTYKGKKYVITDKIEAAPGITFLWTKTFPIGFYAPAIIPLIIVFTITSIGGSLPDEQYTCRAPFVRHRRARWCSGSITRLRAMECIPFPREPGCVSRVPFTETVGDTAATMEAR